MGSLSVKSFQFLSRTPFQCLVNINAKPLNFTKQWVTKDIMTVSLRRNCIKANKTDNVPEAVKRASVPSEVVGQIFHKDLIHASDIADYADRAPVLQKLIDLGVSIYKFNDDRALCEFLLRLNFDKDVKPYIEFLHANGVPADSLGNFFTRNPYILKCDLDDLQVRINYLESKKFTKEMIAHIITANPKWLSLPVKFVDERLGLIQSTLEVSGDDIRTIVMKFPGIANIKKTLLKLNMFTVKEELDLTKVEVKKLILREPRMLKIDNDALLHTLHFLHNVMEVPIQIILDQPIVLNTRVHLLFRRHKFLHKLGRAQYNPSLPGYVSLTEFVSSNDEKFCQTIALSSLDNYYNFIKTL